MDYLHIRGTVDALGSFTPDWWSTAPSGEVPGSYARSDSVTGWQAAALDYADQVLARASATLVEVPICPGGSQLVFSAVLTLPDGTSSVAILEGDREVFRRVVPDSAVVRLEEHLDPRLRRQHIELPVQIDGPEPRSGAYI